MSARSRQRNLRPRIINMSSILTPAPLAGASDGIRSEMTKQMIELDMRRGMAAQKATELRRQMLIARVPEDLVRLSSLQQAEMRHYP